ncbi:MA3 domain-containing protein [Klebsormidium nitens]|uniref:MA3 domain-containing protein n=1 Tax=Klebsormidium nitens TaxID=105231 RepID=A0A1Y1HXF9_KLENI|nr:MA3 domain-containing protein [Klebsormidium nitens]|eukprot:GAQ81206.1 MA3 domain-containing protein [Klebsormidium nitens]
MTSPSNGSFLTDEQRNFFYMSTEAETLNNEEIASGTPSIQLGGVAIPGGGKLEKAPSSGAKLTTDHATKNQSTLVPKAEKKSHAKYNGRPKKGGQGGKGTWTGSGKFELPDDLEPVDKNDPNYDSDEDGHRFVGADLAKSVVVFKERVLTIIDEYFASDDVKEVAAALDELEVPGFHHHFVKKLVSRAMDKNDREKEQASALLSALYADVIAPDQMAKGFTKLLESVEDLSLDIPDAVELLSLFLARAVVDDILPPAFLSRTGKSLAEGSLPQTVVRKAEARLGSRHAAERVERCWGGSTNKHVDEVKDKIKKLLLEYVDSGDKAEATRCIKGLSMPFFHHEVVKQALIMAMERKKADQLLLDLLAETAASGLITSSQMAKGFGRVSDAVDDLSLDVPDAREKLAALAGLATADGWLSESAGKQLDHELHSPVVGSEATRKFKAKVRTLIQEYFLSDDIGEVTRSLDELGHPELHHVFVKHLVTSAMDRHAREKEMASALISAIDAEVVSTDEIGRAFRLLLEQAEDLALDIPDAAYELALFLARAVVDDVLPPLYLSQVQNQLKDGSLGQEIVHTASAIVSARHAGERVLRCWGGGAGRTVEDAKESIKKLLDEYAAGGTITEACQCIRDLSLPFFHHEVVKKALILAMEKQTERLLALLAEAAAQGLISTSQIVKGFGRVYDALDDLMLDIPNARTLLEGFVGKAKEGGWLPAGFEAPTRAANGKVE